MISEVNLSDTLKKRALDIGFDLVGIAPISIWPDLEFSQQWVASGFGGEMRYLANPKRADPKLVLPTAESIICLGLVYNAALPYSTEMHAKPQPLGVQEPRGWVSRYAWGRDYHRVMRNKLERVRQEIEALAPGAQTRVYVDTGPIVERAFARFSGIGWMGKNTCLINEEKGSWFFLGVVLSSLALEPDLPAPDRCGSCTRCLEACPTGALARPYVMDASRCIAYLTIEKKGSIPPDFRPAIGLNVFGCDICQDVCPWNSSRQNHPRSSVSDRKGRSRGAEITNAAEFQPLEIETGGIRPPANSRGAAGKGLSLARLAPGRSNPEPVSVSLFNPPLHALASLDEEGFRRAFSRSPVKRAKYRGWLRNLCVAIGNSGDTSFIPWLERACEHPDTLIREHASWALARLQGAKI
jgi:epoxyqueuosine reductase